MQIKWTTSGFEISWLELELQQSVVLSVLAARRSGLLQRYLSSYPCRTNERVGENAIGGQLNDSKTVRDRSYVSMGRCSNGRAIECAHPDPHVPPNRGVANRRPQIEHIVCGRRAAWSPLWWWPWIACGRSLSVLEPVDDIASLDTTSDGMLFQPVMTVISNHGHLRRNAARYIVISLISNANRSVFFCPTSPVGRILYCGKTMQDIGLSCRIGICGRHFDHTTFNPA